MPDAGFAGHRGAAGTMTAMLPSLSPLLGAAETVWHYWIAVALAIPAIAIPVILVVLYLRIVVMPRYPRK
jgi:hypothetical protein